MSTEIEDFIKKTETPYETTFWGEKYIVTPKVVFGSGDALQFVAVQPLDTRPQWYVVRIDSSVDIEADDFKWDQLLLCPIEDEFGNATDYTHDYNDAGDYVARRFDAAKDEPWEPGDITDFPVLNWSGGCWWVKKNFGIIQAKS